MIGPLMAARSGRSACAAMAALFPAVALLIVAFRTSRIFEGHVFRYQADWIPTLGLNIAFRLDGLSLLFSTLILGIGAILMASIFFFSLKESGISIKEFLIILFIFLSAPITANMLSKAALHVRMKPRSDTLNRDRFEAIRERRR
jgi:monovalent cation/proton antiporter MnhG/PhaG subunit